MSDSVRAASGHELDAGRFAAAASAVETIATNNSQLLVHNYGTSREDVMAVVQLAKECWFKKSKKG